MALESEQMKINYLDVDCNSLKDVHAFPHIHVRVTQARLELFVAKCTMEHLY